MLIKRNTRNRQEKDVSGSGRALSDDLMSWKLELFRFLKSSRESGSSRIRKNTHTFLVEKKPMKVFFMCK